MKPSSHSFSYNPSYTGPAVSDHHQIDSINNQVQSSGHVPAFLNQPSQQHTLLSRYVSVKRSVERVTWSTPRRRVATGICLVLLVLVFYVVGRAVDALNIKNSTPALSSVRLSNLCNQGFIMDIELAIFNPSNAFATAHAMTTTIFLVEPGSTNLTSVVCGYVVTPDMSIAPGHQLINVSFSINISTSAIPGFQKVLNMYLSDAPIDLLAQVPLVVSFPSSVFLVPLTLPIPLELDFSIPAANATVPGATTSSPTSPEYEPAHFYKGVEILQSVDPANWGVLALHVNLLARSTLASSVFSVVVPPLCFSLLANQLSVATVQTDSIYFGKTLPPGVATTSFGVVSFKGAANNTSIRGFQKAADLIIGGYPIDLTVVAAALSTPDINVTLDTQTGQVCWLQQVLEGISYSFALNVGSLASEKGARATMRRRRQSSVPINIPVPFVILDGISLTNVNSSSAAVNVLLDLGAMGALINVYGVFPALEFVVTAYRAGQSSSSAADLFSVRVPSFPIDLTNFNLPLNIQVLDFASTLNLAYGYSNGVNVLAGMRSNSSSALFWSRLLSSLAVELNVASLLKQAPLPFALDSTPSSRARRLQSNAERIIANLTSDANGIFLSVTLSGFDSAAWNGAHIAFGAVSVQVSTRDYSRPLAPMQTIASFSCDAYDSSDAVPVTFQLGIMDQYPSPNQGTFVQQVFTQILNGTNISLQVAGTYNALSTFGGPVDLKLNVSTPDASNNASQVASNSSFWQRALGGLGLQVSSTTLVSPLGNQLVFDVFFSLSLNTTPIVLNLTLPTISVGTIQCGQPKYDFLILTMDAWTFSTARPLSFAVFNGTIIDDVTALYLATESALYYIDICIVPLPLAPNLLSIVLGSLNVSFQVSAPSSGYFETALVSGFSKAVVG